jgi:hypothetical protein
MEKATDCALWLGIARADARHHPAASFFVDDIDHLPAA